MRFFTLCLLFLIHSSCTKNFFDEFAKKDTKEAIFFDAKLKLNESNYSSAITSFNALAASHASYYASENMLPLHASAFAGRCGLDFISLLTDIQGASSGSLFGLLMGAFPSATVTSYTDCLAAEDLLETIGDETARNGDENLLMAFLSLAKIGVILSSRADADNDQVADAGFDQCDEVTDLPTAEAREIGSGLALFLKSIAAVGASYFDITAIQTACAINADTMAMCDTTDPTLITNDQLSTLRVFLGSSDYGINSCGGADFTNCLLANPPPSCGP